MMQSYESHRSRIIVTADDFGISPRANRNTLYLISIGKINRVAIMVHGEMSKNEIERLNRSELKLDIHLDILHKFNHDRKERSGTAARIFEFVGKFISGKISSAKVEHEWDEQIELFKKIFGRYPDGINSHEHVHLFPPFFKAVLRLSKKYKIPYIRFGDSIILRHNSLVSRILHYLRLYNRKRFSQSSNVSSGSFVSLDWLEDIDMFLDNLPEGTIEIASHPELAEDFVKIKQYF